MLLDRRLFRATFPVERLDRVRGRLFGQPDIVLHLKTEPIASALPKECTKAYRQIGGHRSLFAKEGRQALRRNAQTLGQCRFGEPDHGQNILAEHFAGMGRSCKCLCRRVLGTWSRSARTYLSCRRSKAARAAKTTTKHPLAIAHASQLIFGDHRMCFDWLKSKTYLRKYQGIIINAA